MSGSTMTRAAALTRVTGQSGRQYFVERLLQDRPSRHGRVYLATLVITINNEQMTERLTFPCRSRDRRYVLKTVPTTIYDRYKAMFDDLRGTPYIHVAEDTDSEICAFIYPYRRDDLLSFAQQDVPLATTKRILRDVLRGIAALHAKRIVHADIKPSNILLDWDDQGGEPAVNEVQIADMEDAVHVPDGRYLGGKQWGNWMWRSPEAHAAAAVNRPTDMFSFGLVVSGLTLA
jgi:serine/threonine protein kinase